MRGGYTKEAADNSPDIISQSAYINLCTHPLARHLRQNEDNGLANTNTGGNTDTNTDRTHTNTDTNMDTNTDTNASASEPESGLTTRPHGTLT